METRVRGRLLLSLWLFALFVSIPSSAQVDNDQQAHKAQVMIVGAYHFVSKANVHTMVVDDPATPKRQAEIIELVSQLARFAPTKIVLEQTSGTSDLEHHYTDYLRGTVELSPSENYQVGFRLAKLIGLRKIHTISAWTDFDYDAVKAFAKSHAQEGLIDAADNLAKESIDECTDIQERGSIIEVYRYLNSDRAIRLNNAQYMYLARVGDAKTYVGANLVAQWHLRNLEMYARLTRLIDSPNDRILVLYGQGHSYLLRDFVRESPDITLIDAENFMQ